MLNKYTFSQNCKIKQGIRWHCSGRKIGCKAHIHTTEDMTIIRIVSNHIHPPPTYIQTLNGKYAKVYT